MSFLANHPRIGCFWGRAQRVEIRWRARLPALVPGALWPLLQPVAASRPRILAALAWPFRACHTWTVGTPGFPPNPQRRAHWTATPGFRHSLQRAQPARRPRPAISDRGRLVSIGSQCPRVEGPLFRVPPPWVVMRWIRFASQVGRLRDDPSGSQATPGGASLQASIMSPEGDSNGISARRPIPDSSNGPVPDSLVLRRSSIPLQRVLPDARIPAGSWEPKSGRPTIGSCSLSERPVSSPRSPRSDAGRRCHPASSLVP
jgi:hypothetical protein